MTQNNTIPETARETMQRLAREISKLDQDQRICVYDFTFSIDRVHRL